MRAAPPALHLFRSARFAIAAPLAAILIGGASCGEQKSSTGMLTVVLVRQELSDGSFAPLENAKVSYEIYGSRAVDTIRKPLYHEFEDMTDSNGISAVFREELQRGPTDIGFVLVDAELPDGRTAFNRRAVEARFDFKQWLNQVLPRGSDPAKLIEIICATAVSFPRCKEALEADGLVAWGVGLDLRFRQNP